MVNVTLNGFLAKSNVSDLLFSMQNDAVMEVSAIAEPNNGFRSDSQP